MAEEMKRAFGLAVSGTRDRRKMSQRQLALLARLNRTYLSRIEAGLADPTLDVQFRIATALGMDLVRLAELARQEQQRLRREAAEAASQEEESRLRDEPP